MNSIPGSCPYALSRRSPTPPPSRNPGEAPRSARPDSARTALRRTVSGRLSLAPSGREYAAALVVVTTVVALALTRRPAPTTEGP